MISANKPLSIPHALVIEDEPILQLVHRTILEKMGFVPIVVDNAQKAIAKWDEPWDLIFSDIGLPDMRGTELCRQRREYEKGLGIRTPAFAYSAFGNSIKNECLEAGFDAFGVKPMDAYALYQSLQQLLPQFALMPLKTSGC